MLRAKKSLLRSPFMNMMKLSRLASSIVVALALFGCGSKSTIDLQKQPDAPAQQAPPSSKPSPANPANPDNPAENPERPDNPVERGPSPARYRLVCEGARDVSSFISAETSARSFDPIMFLYVAALKDSNQEVTRANYNIVRTNNPIPVPNSATDRLDILFTGIKIDHEHDPRLFLANVDAVLRTGKAADLGPAPSTSKETRGAADALGLAAANYGASDQGHFLILPSSGGFKITNRSRTRTFGTISGNTSNTILPKIYEGKGIYTALVYNGHGFSPVALKLSISSSTVSVSKTIELGSSGTATPLQNYSSSTLAWSETSFVGSNTITIAKVDTTTFKITRATYKTDISSAKIYPQIAVVKDERTERPTVYVAIESVSYNPAQANKGAHVAFAKLQSLTFEGARLVEGEPLDYPDVSLLKVQTSGLRGKWIVKALFATDNEDQLLGTFDSPQDYQVFTNRGGSLDGVGSVGCTHPQVTEENL